MVWAKAYYIIKNIYKVKAFGGQWAQGTSVTPHESDQTHEGEHSRRVLIGIIWHIPDRFTIDYLYSEIWHIPDRFTIDYLYKRIAKSNVSDTSPQKMPLPNPW